MSDDNCACWASTSIYEPLKYTNCTYQSSDVLHKPLWGANCTWRTSARFHEPLYEPTKLLTCFTSFCQALTAFVQPVTAFTCPRGMLRTFAKPLSTRLRKPLLDANRVCRTSTSFHEAKAANCSYQTFTGLHMFLTPLAETLLACANLWRKLTVPTTCFTSFCRALTAFVQPVSAFTSLCGMLSGFAKPLPDLTNLC